MLSEDDAGRPLEAFTPDFYLPEFDVYLELTTLRQQLVTRKNRKVSVLEQRHPDVHVKILTRGDYATLVERFGMEDTPAPPGHVSELVSLRSTPSIASSVPSWSTSAAGRCPSRTRRAPSPSTWRVAPTLSRSTSAISGRCGWRVTTLSTGCRRR